MRLLAILLLTGCATPWKSANCQRFRYFDYNVLACDSVAVGNHCAAICPKNDRGEPLKHKPVACFKPGQFGRKATIFIGKRYMGCLPHEICHLERPFDPLYCEQKYPCVGD